MPSLSRSPITRLVTVAAVLSPLCGTMGQTPAASQQTAQTSAAQAITPAPFKAGENFFYTASNGALYVREQNRGRPRMLLDANSFTELAPSRDGKYLAYMTPAVGAAGAEVRIRNVASDRDLADVLYHAVISRAPWTANNKGFFYIRTDSSDHRQRVYYHHVGQSESHDRVMYSRQDAPDWGYEARVSDDGQYAVFTISHPIDAHTRLYFIDLDNPDKPDLDAPVVKLVDDFGARYEFIDNGGQSFFLQTDHLAPRGRVVLANTEVTREARWPQILAEKDSTDTLQFVRTAGDDYVIAVYRSGAKSHAQVLGFPSEEKIRDEMRRRDDSIRTAGGAPDDRPGNGGRGGAVIRPMGAPPQQRPQLARDNSFAWRLEVKRTISVPVNATVLDMRSLADQDEIFYTVRYSTGAVGAYRYDVKTGAQSSIDLRPPTP